MRRRRARRRQGRVAEQLGRLLFRQPSATRDLDAQALAQLGDHGRVQEARLREREERLELRRRRDERHELRVDELDLRGCAVAVVDGETAGVEGRLCDRASSRRRACSRSSRFSSCCTSHAARQLQRVPVEFHNKLISTNAATAKSTTATSPWRCLKQRLDERAADAFLHRCLLHPFKPTAEGRRCKPTEADD